MAKQARLVHEQCDVAVVDLSDNITTVFDGPCVVYGVYVNTVLSAQACPIQDGTQAQRTNLILRSTLEGGDPPTGWTEPIGTGDAIAQPSVLFSDVKAVRFTASAQRPFLNQAITLVATTTYTLSVHVEDRTTDPAGRIFEIIGLSGASGQVFADVSDIDADGRIQITFTTAASLSGNIRMGIGTLQNQTGDITMSAPQLETGISATEFIPTTDTIRSADMPPIVLPASFAAGSNRDFPGIRFDKALVVNPDDAATGEITITYRSVNPN